MGEMSQFDDHILSKKRLKPPTSFCLSLPKKNPTKRRNKLTKLTSVAGICLERDPGKPDWTAAVFCRFIPNLPLEKIHSCQALKPSEASSSQCLSCKKLGLKESMGKVCVSFHVVYFLTQSLRCEVFWLLLLIHVPDSCSDRDSTPPMCTYTKHVCFNLETEAETDWNNVTHTSHGMHGDYHQLRRPKWGYTPGKGESVLQSDRNRWGYWIWRWPYWQAPTKRWLNAWPVQKYLWAKIPGPHQINNGFIPVYF